MVGVPVMEDAEKTELQNAFWASVFTAEASPRESQTAEVRERAQRREDSPSIEADRVRGRFDKGDARTSTGRDGKHPRAPREPADVIAKTLFVFSERSRRTGEVPKDRRKGNVAPVL